MKPLLTVVASVLVVALVVILSASLYVIYETEQAIITQFGRPVGEPITSAGLHVRLPFIQKVNVIDKRVLEWDGAATQMPTKDKLYITVDTFARWRIKDPLQYYLRLKDERSAQSRLNDILGSETRNAVAKHELIEIIRTTKDRQPAIDETLMAAGEKVTGHLPPIRKGRTTIEAEIIKQAAVKVKDFGIELLDVRFKRINYTQEVRVKIYDRMISERLQIANRFRSEGEGEAEIILGSMQRDLQEIESEAYKKIQEIKGEADARASEIYASAYNQTPAAVALYEFLGSLDAYQSVLDDKSTVVLSTDSDLFRYLKSAE